MPDERAARLPRRQVRAPQELVVPVGNAQPGQAPARVGFRQRFPRQIVGGVAGKVRLLPRKGNDVLYEVKAYTAINEFIVKNRPLTVPSCECRIYGKGKKPSGLDLAIYSLFLKDIMDKDLTSFEFLKSRSPPFCPPEIKISVISPALNLMAIM